jgi:hypothetical protein
MEGIRLKMWPFGDVIGISITGRRSQAQEIIMKIHETERHRGMESKGF